ncbi:MAG: carbohydrate porin [Chlamydiota bacterium]|nr:carbohydrate porin [Chlamydiota bacterium]
MLYFFIQLFLFIITPISLIAEENNSQPIKSPHADPFYDNFESESDPIKGVSQILEFAESEKQGILQWNPLDPLKKRWDNLNQFLQKKYRLELGTAYTTLYQKASEGITHDEAAGGDFDLFGICIVASDLKLGFATEIRSRYTEIPPNLLGPAIGSLWKTTSTFSNYSYKLIRLWIDYQLIRDRLRFIAGKIDLTDYVYLYRFSSPNFNFIGQGMTSGLTIPIPSNGLTFLAEYKPTKDTAVIAQVADANGDKRTLSFDTFFNKHEYFSSIEFMYTPNLPSWGKGNYNLVFWYIDPRKDFLTRSSYGIAFTLEQECTEGIVPFLRYGYTNGKATTVQQFVTTGIGFLAPFSRKDDEYGIGYTWGHPSNGTLREQFSIETYYRLQLTHHIQITPDIQIYINPSNNPGENVIGVFSIRGRIDI